MRIWKLSSSLFLVMMLLTGCLYPEEELAENQTPYKEQVQAVQAAINQFQEANEGVLPIKTTEGDTPLYQKYLIDFKRLVPQYLSEPPGNSYENGGVFQYVIINPETDVQVKIFDLRIAEKIREIKLLIKAYGNPPFKEKIAQNVYSLNFDKLGYKEEPTVTSPYTNQSLSFVVTESGEIYVDYRNDLLQALQEKDHSFKPGDDIRSILVEDSMFVPAYSLPYTIDESSKEPIFLMN
ncbi:hypothetical protein H1Z61_02690 [Bacillus aquiflavi]|uniref:ABC transporter periplasmic binding protein yphF n=1 Tax=Bacillus aquiflavi TaxID=2672567 RepID=A0A6B3VVZ9_9BACI|nr:hypothetical protein [Bacillus aquiflavi]MBA4536073.1 hypothetical protein [Bacillus aquiflavi]NEY80447.1 hypothetical protein [Bacillus aquiflavi]UAC47080.1 hypothetical protein K6959_09935 [Bacillus aquiflavi]